MTKIIQLPPNLKLVRISKRHRGRRSEFTQIGQDAARRFMKDFDLPTAAEARGILREMINDTSITHENHRAAWMCEGTPSDPFAETDPTDQITVDVQILKLLGHVAIGTLRLDLVDALSDKTHATVSRQFLQALRLIVEHHPNATLRSTYVEEIDHILGSHQ